MSPEPCRARLGEVCGVRKLPSAAAMRTQDRLGGLIHDRRPRDRRVATPAQATPRAAAVTPLCVSRFQTPDRDQPMEPGEALWWPTVIALSIDVSRAGTLDT